jgi:peptidyl-tRNA hydrolase
MTLSQIVEAQLAALNRAGGEHSSVRLTRNAKGDTQIEVTVRTGDESHLLTVADAAEHARTIYDSLRDAYPLAQNGSPE